MEHGHQVRAVPRESLDGLWIHALQHGGEPGDVGEQDRDQSLLLGERLLGRGRDIFRHGWGLAVQSRAALPAEPFIDLVLRAADQACDEQGRAAARAELSTFPAVRSATGALHTEDPPLRRRILFTLVPIVEIRVLPRVVC
jgi:hypothetical protein